MKLVIVNACSDLGVQIDGSEKGPLSLTKVTQKETSYTVMKEKVEKERDKENHQKNIGPLNRFNEKLYHAICNIDSFVLTIGGDHSIAIASCLASLKKHKEIGLIWVDAHGDFHRFDTTISGNIHGMPFATVCGKNGKLLSSFFDGDYFDPSCCVLVGGRDIEKEEYENLLKSGVTIFSTEDIHKRGVSNVMKEALAIANRAKNGFHVSYDLDVIDPLIAPGVSVKAKEGINLEEAQEILGILVDQKDKLKSFDLVEFNPDYDIQEKTYKIAESFLQTIIQKKK